MLYPGDNNSPQAGPDAPEPLSPPPPRELVELKPRLRNRFYEPLVLLMAATKACMHNLAPRVPEPAPDRLNQTDEQLFHDYMNKLAQICDAQPHGATVTSNVALAFPDRVQYRFASNQRSPAKLARMREFVDDVLRTLQDWDEGTSDIVLVRVLRKVVAFNRPRLQVYVQSVMSNSEMCLKTVGLGDVFVENLKNLFWLSSSASDKDLDDNKFFQHCLLLMKDVRKLSRSRASRMFRDRANAGGQSGDGPRPWAELRHAAGRLLSYLEGAQTLIEARSVAGWEPLFYEFEVVCLASSRAEPNPIAHKRAGAADILHRMWSGCDGDVARLEGHQRDAEDLQRFGLDEHIMTLKNGSNGDGKSFRPIVHAEILVHESLVNDPDVGDLHRARFFGGYRYIGSSKPTCRLCHYYFHAVGDGVQVRQTHRNLYAAWRAPDVYQDQRPIGGRPAWKRREDILNNMVNSIRKDTFRTLSDKVSERKVHDSNTSQTYKRGASVDYSSRAGEDVDDITSTMGGVELSD